MRDSRHTSYVHEPSVANVVSNLMTFPMCINRVYSLRHKYKYKLLILQIYREVFANKKGGKFSALNEKDMDRTCDQAQGVYEPIVTFIE